MNKKIALALIAIGIVINIVGGTLNTALKLPLFLDSIGTMLAAVILGPWLGALTGILSNVFQGIAADPITIPFAIVNGVIGLVVGFIARKRGFQDYVSPLLVGIILAFLAPILGTPIAVYLFGGVTGGGVDILYTVLLNSSHEIFASAFLARIPANLFDKLISAYLVMFIIRRLPSNLKGIAGKETNLVV
ncbi:CD3073 family putative ECF transporter S component [Desulfosporosinus sp. FKB]|uniref:CD3073 family putative ECF transporter S component n=1 Tax=Desulfosporosinus sp. FKB TaxID=1969835 RepID=UPI000B4A1CC7|nr:CD3073 family putative ECF transporter S component [Desulfosporosinus sp. FKB]